MANKGKAAFTEFTAGLLAKIPDPDQRRKAEESINALAAIDPVAQALGDGIAGQSEIDRQLQTLTQQTEELNTRKTDLDAQEARLQTWHADLTTWYSDNKALIETAKGKKPVNGNPDPKAAPKPGELPAGVLTEEQYNEKIAAERAGFLGYQRDQNLITREHFSKFGEIVDIEPLLRHPQIGQIGLVGVYELTHKDRLDKWKADTAEADRKKIADEAVRKYQETQAQMPYPAPTGAGSGSPLDALTVTKKDALVDEATAHYHRLQAERLAGTPGR